jgi:hypothetical protein
LYQQPSFLRKLKTRNSSCTHTVPDRCASSAIYNYTEFRAATARVLSGRRN